MNVHDLLELRPKPENYKRSHDDFLHPNVCVQDKLDGWRMTVFRGEDIQIIGRKEYINLWDILKDTPLSEKILKLPHGTVLDGEYHGTGCGTDVPTLMRNGQGTFTPWAMPYLDGECLMGCSIGRINDMLTDLGWIPPYTRPLLDNSIEHLMQEAERKGIEGYVLKLEQWEGWIKVKPTRTFDLIVTDVVRGGVRGSIKSLVVAARCGTEVGKVGGLTDQVRASDPVGRVVEVRVQDVTRDGILKFARLVRFRDDKDTLNTLEDIRG